MKYPEPRTQYFHICNYDSYISDEENKQWLNQLYRVIRTKIQPILSQRKKKEGKENNPLHYVIWSSLTVFISSAVCQWEGFVWIKYSCGRTHLSSPMCWQRQDHSLFIFVLLNSGLYIIATSWKLVEFNRIDYILLKSVHIQFFITTKA